MGCNEVLHISVRLFDILADDIMQDKQGENSLPNFLSVNLGNWFMGRYEVVMKL